MGTIKAMAKTEKGTEYLAIGNATRDAEYKEVGDKMTPLTKWGMAVGENKDGETRYIDCAAWGRNAPGGIGIKKGDAVLCYGRLESREYNEKTYYELRCEFVSVMRAQPISSNSVPASGGDGLYQELQDANEDELPF